MLHYLGRKELSRILFFLNFVVALGVIYASRDLKLADSTSYLMLADGITAGNYSQYWPLGDGYPDTTRTPGFPLYVAAMVAVFGENGIVWPQLVLYMLAIWGTTIVIKRYDPGYLAQNLFLLLLIPMVNVPFYIGQVYPEIPVLAALVAVTHAVTTTRPRWWHGVGVGLLYGFVFQCKPVFILFPVVILLVAMLLKDKVVKTIHVIAVPVFVITLLPYGIWNLRNHGVFKITPLESGGGLAHIGIWAAKIPGYTEKFHWGNFTGDELIRFVPEDSIPVYVDRYEQEWVELQKELEPLLTERDTIMLASRSEMPRPVMRTYNSEYTKAREKRLIELSVQHALEDPGYFIITKLYSAVRIWVMGIQRKELEQADGLQKMKLMFPVVYTGLIFVLALTTIPLAYHRRRWSIKQTYVCISLLLYFWVFHLPFAIQARYSIPVRLVMLAMIALSVAVLARPKPVDLENGDT